MSRIKSSLASVSTGVARNISDSQYDNITTVAQNIEMINDAVLGLNQMEVLSADLPSVVAVATNITAVLDVYTEVLPNMAEILLADSNAALATSAAGIATAAANSIQTLNTSASTGAVSNAAYVALTNTIEFTLEKGEIGNTGESAYDSAVALGFVGTKADWIASLEGTQGIQGIQGVKGDIGDQGIQGITGNTGSSAYQLAVSNGFVGTESAWLLDLVGAQGIQGIQGIKGDTGSTGNGIADITRTSGTGIAGSTDTYTITYTDTTTDTFSVYNGADGLGSGDMLKATYDTTNNGIVDNAEKVNGLTVGTAVPTGALFTDTVYSHPTTDGNLHVPATSTTNSGKVLTAGATAGSVSWETIPAGVTDHTLLSNIGTNAHSAIDTALSRLANTSGTNTGDQDLSSYSTTSHTHTGTYEPVDTTLVRAPLGVLPILDGSNLTGIVSGVSSVSGTAPVVSSGGATPAISMAAATALVNGYMTSAYASKLDGIEAGANNYALPASVVHDTESGALHATDALRVSGTTLSLYKGDGTFESITTQDTVYTHPSTYGSLHVPATSTTNSGKVLTAGATAGSMTWESPASVPSTLDALTDVVITTPSTDQVLKYNGTTWVNSNGASGVTFTKTEFSATAGQTIFTVAYTVGLITVSHNGLILSASDYTAINGSTVTLVVPAALNDLIVVQAFSTFTVANTYTIAQVDSIATNLQSQINTSMSKLYFIGGM